MMEYRRIFGQGDSDWSTLWALYVLSFPSLERRDLEYQLSTLKRENYYCEAVFDTLKDCFVGFIMWWDFEEFRFVEHLATDPQLRGGGYGARILEDFMARSNVPVYLEVEYPDEPLKARRIGFYERCGFTLNHHSYAHPPMDSQSDEFVELLVMTSNGEVTSQMVERFKSITFPVVHFGYYCRAHSLSPPQSE